MGKDIESFDESLQQRREFLQKYGLVPTTILKRSPKSIVNDPFAKGSYDASNRKLLQSIHPLLRKGFAAGNKGCGSGALSRFPDNVGQIIILFYSEEGDVVYDPFAGHNSRMQLTYSCNRSYIGVDISSRFIKHMKRVCRILREREGKKLFQQDINITLLNQSSQSVQEVKNNSCDFSITSPPYWDIEYYGDEDGQLGKAKTYEAFLEDITPCIRESFRVLKPGAYCSWFVNDFTRRGVFYPYHSDLIQCFRRVGFVSHAVYIVDLMSSLGSIFLKTVNATKRFGKQHEYCLMFKKPLNT